MLCVLFHGARANLNWDSIDFGQRNVRIKPEKGSNPRMMPLSAKVIDMLCNLPRNGDKPLANADHMRSCFFQSKRRIVKRLAAPNLMKIHFHTMRHWKGTMEQHKTKDPWHVKTILGHKSIKSTETYIHIEQMLYQGDANDQFTVKVANTMKEATKLMEVGFEFHCEIEGNKLFRKPK